MLRHGAELALGEAFGGDGEGAVEAGAGIFPGDDGGEFDELGLGKMLAQGGVEFVGDGGWIAGHGDGKPKNSFFAVVKMGTGFKLRDVLQLLFGDAGSSAHGRMDINSKRAAHHEGGLQLG
jgi:hypothetical protein